MEDILVDYPKTADLAERVIMTKERERYPFDREIYYPDADVPSTIQKGSKEL